MKEIRPGEIDCESGTVFWPFGYNHELFLPYLSKRHGKSWIEAAREKEATTMQVTYNGFTGELVKLELNTTNLGGLNVPSINGGYQLHIFDREKQVNYSFTGVRLEDVKFLGGAVAFGG